MNATHQHNFLPEVDGNGLKTGVVSCDCGAWEQGGEDEGVYVEGNRITDAGAWQCEGCGSWVDPDPATPEGRGHQVPNEDGSPGYCGPVSRRAA